MGNIAGKEYEVTGANMPPVAFTSRDLTKETEKGVIGYGATLSRDGSGCPVTFCDAKMPADVLDYLVSNVEDFSLSEKKLQKHPCFKRCVDHHKIPGHIYYEGYYHAVGEVGLGKNLLACNPRMGDDIQKSPAPVALFSFLEAFRTKNKHIFDQISDRISGDTLPERTIKEMIASGRHFGDVAVQVHYGDGVAESDINWHIDALQSVMHLALSVRGHRALHSRKRKTPMPAAAEEAKGEDAEGGPSQSSRGWRQRGQPPEDEHFIDWQSPGDMYLSTPSATRHGVEYPSSNFKGRIVAVQCRLATDLRGLVNMENDADGIVRVLETVAEAFAQHKFEPPTLDEIKAAEARLRGQQASEATQ